MRSRYTASCYVCGGQVWVSQSHLWITITSHVFNKHGSSREVSTSILSVVKTVSDLNSCSIVAFSYLTHAPTHNPTRLWSMSQAVIQTTLSRVYFNGMCVVLHLRFCKAPGHPHPSASIAVSEKAVFIPSKTNLAQGPPENTLGPCPFGEARKLTLSDWIHFTPGTGLVYTCHFYKDFMLKHKPTGASVLESLLRSGSAVGEASG